MSKEDLNEIIDLIKTGEKPEFLNEKYKKLTMDEFEELKSLIKKEYGGRKPRTTFYKFGNLLNQNEMTQEEIEESRLGIWWLKYSNGNIFLKIKNNNKFEQYIEWVIKHQDKESGKFRYPRSSIAKNSKTLTISEITEDEKIERRLGQWWNANPYERRILEKYKDATEQEFLNLPEEIQNILLISNKYELTPICKILQQMKLCVKDNVGDNIKIRSELQRLVIEFNKKEENER